MLEATVLCWSVEFLGDVGGWGTLAGCWCSSAVLAVSLLVFPRLFLCWSCVVPGPPVLFFLITPHGIGS